MTSTRGALSCLVALSLLWQGHGCNTDATSCGDCVSVKDSKCYWCPTEHVNNKTKYPKQQCFAVGDDQVHPCAACDSEDNCKRNTCVVSTKTLYIIIGSVAGALVLGISLWIWCCCRRRSKKRLETYLYKEDKKTAKARKAREERQSARKAERAEKTDAIRNKYGLQKNTEDDDDILLGDDDYGGRSDDMGMRW